MKNLLLIISILFLTSIVGCNPVTKENASSTELEVSPDNSLPVAICIWKEISVKESPNEKGKYLTSVFLGEKLTVLADTASERLNNRIYSYQKVKLADGSQGWIRSEFIAINATPAAFLKDATIYKRPDLMTSSKKSFNAMDFVAIKNLTQDGWAEVIGKRAGDTWFSSGWVKEENLTKDSKDITFSVLFTKAMDIRDTDLRTAEVKSILNTPELAGSLFFTRVNDIYGDGLQDGDSYEDSESNQGDQDSQSESEADSTI
jgi:hypothetical protein